MSLCLSPHTGDLLSGLVGVSSYLCLRIVDLCVSLVGYCVCIGVCMHVCVVHIHEYM